MHTDQKSVSIAEVGFRLLDKLTAWKELECSEMK
jgi:hypothetical protein